MRPERCRWPARSPPTLTAAAAAAALTATQPPPPAPAAAAAGLHNPSEGRKLTITLNFNGCRLHAGPGRLRRAGSLGGRETSGRGETRRCGMRMADEEPMDDGGSRRGREEPPPVDGGVTDSVLRNKTVSAMWHYDDAS